MRMLKKILSTVLLLGTVLAIPSGYAQDIDIYARPPSTTNNPALNPNVLIVIDNSANWAAANQQWPGGIKQGQAELDALRTVIGGLSDNINVGLMMFTAGTGSNPNGGYIRFAIRPMTATNKAALSELIGYPSGCTNGPNSLNGTADCIYQNFNGSEKVSTAQTDYSAAMLDVFKYFGGYTWPAHVQDGLAGANVDASQFGIMRYAGNPDVNSDPAAYTTDANKTSYISPLTSTNNCAKNYLIFIGNGFPTQDSASSLLGPPSLLPGTGVGGDVTLLPIPNLASTTTTNTALLATTACGTYSSVSACNADTANFSATYPGYSSYSCAAGTTCSSGSTTTSTATLGTSSCLQFTSQSSCQSALPGLYPGYTSYSCSAGTSCTSSSSNATNPLATQCVANSVHLGATNNAAACNSYGAANWPNYSGFTCTSATGTCSGGSAMFRIDATTYNAPGTAYTMYGTSTSTVSSTSYSQTISGTYTTIAATPTGTYSAPTKINYFPEWARYLYQTDVSSAPGKQNISTYTIDVFNAQQDLNETQLLITAAQAGGGKYFQATNELAITNAMLNIFSEIQSVNSVFASSSLPVSVNTQGTYLNQVFMGMFRPDGSADPRWFGNLKQYQFQLFNGVLKLADKNGLDAISSTTGFVTPCATSFWSTDTGQYWNYGGAVGIGDCGSATSLFPTAGSIAIYSDAPDGEVVEKGGAAQRLRGVYSSGGTLVPSSQNYQLCSSSQTPGTAQCRMLDTCDGTTTTSCTTITSFDPSNSTLNATTLNLGSTATTTDVNNLIWWVRGQDIQNENSNYDALNNPLINEMRPSVHGGVVHSQPAVIDYGGAIGTVAFYGADDGVFHAVDGNQADTDGVELWGFVAPEFYARLNRLYINSPLIAYPGISGSPAPQIKDYFFDGSTGVYQNTTLGKVWIYPSMRRGGRAIYAFDASVPTSPVIKWRNGCFTSNTTDDTACTTGWSAIGQTWSAPIIAYISGYVDGSGNKKPVLIFGGGYDQCDDIDSQGPCTTTPRKGANIWFVDADTGAILIVYPTNYSVPGDLNPLKDGNGNLTYVYASDTGGNLYRINVGTLDPTGTTFTGWSSSSNPNNILLASMSQTNQARKFLSGPSVVQTSGYNAVLIGSGDREHPLVSDYGCGNYSTTPGSFVTNQFYMLMDVPPGYPGPTLTPGSLVDVTTGTTTSSVSSSGVTTITNVSTSGVTTSSTSGWLFNFGQCEQSVNKALTIAGTTYFGTNTPSATTGSTCTASLGIANGYAVNFLTGGAVSSLVPRDAAFVGGGMPPSPVAGVVNVNGVKYPFCIGCIDTSAANSSALQGGKINVNPSGTRHRAYWYMEND